MEKYKSKKMGRDGVKCCHLDMPRPPHSGSHSSFSFLYEGTPTTPFGVPTGGSNWTQWVTEQNKRKNKNKSNEKRGGSHGGVCREEKQRVEGHYDQDTLFT